MKSLFLYTTPHYSHKTLADKLEITDSLQTHRGGLCGIPLFGKMISSQIIQSKIKKFAPDVILTESLTHDLLAAYFYKRKHPKTKIIAIAADPKLYYLKDSFDIDQILTNASLQSVDWFLCSGRQMQDLLPENKKKSSTVFYPKLNYTPNDYMPKFSNKNDFYFVGSLVKSKGIQQLNNYFVNSNKELIVYGDGPEKYKLHNQIKFRGYNIAPHEMALDECVFNISLALFEPFGLAAIEAMLFGFIPIVTKNCGNKEFVELVNKNLVINSPKEISSAQLEIIKDEQTFKDYSKKCKQIAADYIKQSMLSYEKCYLDTRMMVFHHFLYKR